MSSPPPNRRPKNKTFFNHSLMVIPSSPVESNTSTPERSPRRTKSQLKEAISPRAEGGSDQIKNTATPDTEPNVLPSVNVPFMYDKSHPSSDPEHQERKSTGQKKKTNPKLNFSKSLTDIPPFSLSPPQEDSEEEEPTLPDTAKVSADDIFFGKENDQRAKALRSYNRVKNFFGTEDQSPDPYQRPPVPQRDFYEICFDLLLELTTLKETKRQLATQSFLLPFLNSELNNKVRVVSSCITDDNQSPRKVSHPCFTFVPSSDYSDSDLIKIANTVLFELSHMGDSDLPEEKKVFLPKKKLHIQNLKAYLQKHLESEKILRKPKTPSWKDLGLSLISAEVNYAGRGYQEDQMAVNPDVYIYKEKQYQPRKSRSPRPHLRTHEDINNKNNNNNNNNNNNSNNNINYNSSNDSLGDTEKKPFILEKLTSESPHDPIACFGVYDGHAGKKVSDYCRIYLTPNIVKSTHFPHDIGQAINEGYLKTNQDVEKTLAPNNHDGTTATNVFLTKDSIVAGNVGDSEAFLYRGDEIIPLTKADSGEDESERDRIEKAGGKMLRTYADWRVNGILAVTRSIGDFWLKKPQNLVIADPHIITVQRSPQDDFAVIASDGLWGKMSPAAVRDWVRDYLANPENDPQAIASQLILKALQLKTTDNVTVIVLVFDKDDNRKI